MTEREAAVVAVARAYVAAYATAPLNEVRKLATDLRQAVAELEAELAAEDAAPELEG